MLLIDDQKQQQAVAALRQAQRPCAIYCSDCLTLWVRNKDVELREQPLGGYILNELNPVLEIGTFTLLTRDPGGAAPTSR